MTGSPCATCVHFHRQREDAQTCDAFPDGIPETIAFGGSHSVNVSGDNGVKWEPLPGFEWLAAGEGGA